MSGGVMPIFMLKAAEVKALSIPGDLLSFTSSQAIPRLFPEYCLGF